MTTVTNHSGKTYSIIQEGVFVLSQVAEWFSKTEFGKIDLVIVEVLFQDLELVSKVRCLHGKSTWLPCLLSVSEPYSVVEPVGIRAGGRRSVTLATQALSGHEVLLTLPEGRAPSLPK